VGLFVERFAEGRDLATAHGDFCLCQYRLDRLLPLAPPEVRVEIEGRCYVCSPTEHACMQSSGFDPENHPERLLKPDVHWGGVFVSCSAFVEALGYCERYQGWGREDDDLFHKLGIVCGCQPLRLPGCGRPVLHLEHPRLNSTQEYQRNQAIFEARVRAGAKAMIAQDKECVIK
jgi:hypothetical protein